MNSIINFVLKNKFAVLLMTIIVTAAGLYAGSNMKQEMIPSITSPVITVTTINPGATPDDNAENVSEPIENALKNLNGVEKVTSTSMQNASNVQIQYDFDKDMNEAQDEASDAIANVELPDTAEEPSISKMSFNAFPILALSISSEKESLEDLTTRMEDEIVPAIEGLDGVSSVQISGQQVKEVKLTYDQEALEENGLTEDTVKNVIQGSNVSMPLGLFTFGNSEESVVVDGNVMSLEDFKNIEIPITPSTQGQGAAGKQGQGAAGQGQGAGAQGGAQSGPGAQNAELPTVKLSELAEIELVGEAESISRTNGKESIGVQVIKSSDANTVQVAEAVKKELNNFQDDIDGLKVDTTFDQALPIEDSVSTMLSKAAFGALFAVIIILLFLRNIKSTLISIVSIPLSLLIALLVLNQMDISLNIMTLGAMTVAIGRVVDDSIVVIENIYRRMALKGEKLRGKELVKEATKEMFMPILSSTIVTIAVFLPLGLVSGQIGELFMPFALTIVFALLASLLIAITIVPSMAHRLFKKNLAGQTQMKEHKPSKLAGFYRNILNWSLNHKWIVSGIVILMLVGSLFLTPFIGVSFLPAEEEKTAMITYKPEPGETREQAESEATKAEGFLMDREHVNQVQYSLGSENPMNPGDTNSALFFVEYDKDTPEFEKEKENVINELQEDTESGTWAMQDMSGSGASNALTYYVYGDSVDEIRGTVSEIEKIMNDRSDLTNIDSSLAETYKEYTFAANQEELSKLGLTASQIAMAIMPERSQDALTEVESDGNTYDVKVQTDTESFDNVQELEDKTIQSPTGQEVRIGDVAKVNEGTTSDTVSRQDGKLYAQVSGELTVDDVATTSQEVQKEVDKLDVPSNVSVETAGVSADINESFSQLGIAMLAAIAIVYLVLVITFGGGRAPFAILFSLPFTVIGALVALLIAGETISLNTMIGMLMLIGIVVTNAIVLIDRVIHKEKEGLTTREALLEAGTTRLRPILMTAIATIGALLPLAFGFESSGFISKGLGVTVIGGLTSSTLLTLIVVPIVYEILTKPRRRKKKTAVEAVKEA
ncbi:efflux RND transporter permease subunit [Bacillus gobiensis]|uniref:efflux RND transporter permease subunit n=2 Tax=Bacillus gobiensis TaxID=1441095 RepID=UPI003D1E1AC9